MKKLAIFLIIQLMLITTPVMGQSTKSALTTEINTNFPSNIPQAITAQDVRTTLIDMVNSWVDLNGQGTFNCPINQVMIGFTSLSQPLCGLALTTALANPTGAIGLTVTNGTALTAMRSDAAPPLSSLVQTALTGTNNGVAFGTGTFGFSTTAAGTNNKVFVGNTGSAPSFQTVGGSGGLFDTICSSTIGQIWVRLSSGWGCTSLGYANPVWWGADPTGAADSTSALNSALAASTVIQFPNGKFKFLSAITYNISAGINSVTLRGTGQDNSILTWPNASGGITFNYAGIGSSVHVSDLTFTTGTTNGGSAITLAAASIMPNPANTAVSDIFRVTMRGDDGYAVTDYWTTGLNISNVSNVNVDTLSITAAAAANVGNGIAIIGLPASSAYAVVFNVAKSNFNYLANGIVYESFVQGVTVSQCNFTGGQNGIISPASQTGTLAQLTVSDSQFATTVNGIVTLTAVDGVNISNSFFIPLTNANAIFLSANSWFNITGNFFGGFAGTNSVVIGATVAGSHGMIVGNAFAGGATGVNLQASSLSSLVSSNSFFGQTNTMISNLGTNSVIVDNVGYNPVGVSTPAAPSSGNAYTNGSSPATIYMFATSGISQLVISGHGLLAAAIGANVTTQIDLGPNESFTPTYSGTMTIISSVH